MAQSHKRGVSMNGNWKVLGAFLVVFAMVMTGCTGGAKPISVALSLTSPQNAVAGQVLNITAQVTNDSKTAGVTWSLSGAGALSSQTTTSVTYTAPSPIASNGTATITATSISNPMKVATLTINLQAVTVSLTPSAAQTDEQTQTTAVTAAVGNDPTTAGVTWSLNTGAKGTLSSATTTGVTYNAPASVTVASADTITATSKFDSTKTATLTINLVPPPAVTTSALPSGTVGTAYTTTNLAATGGVSPYTWTVTSASGTFPAGLTLSSAGAISGTPTAYGTFNFTVQAKDANGFTASANLSIKVNPAPVNITTTTLPSGVINTLYSATLASTGGATPITWSWVAQSGSSIPPGLILAATGSITGTPTATGTFNVTVTATDSSTPALTASKNFSITIGQASAFSSGSSTTFTVGTAGTFTVTTTGFPAPALTESGALPSGVTFKDNGNGTGTLSGTPAAGTGKAYAITFTANNGVGSNATQNFTLTVDQAPAITSATSATFTVGAAGSFTVTTTGFPTSALTETGTLPSGVTFVDNGNGTGTLGGTPASGTNGSYPISFTANNGVGSPASQNFTLTVNTAPVVTSANVTTFTVGTAGSFTVTTTGTPTPSLTETGTLPGGVTFIDNGNGTGTLAGTPAAGTGKTYSISFKATNTTGSSTQSFTLTVDQASAITSGNSTTFTVGAAASFTVMTTGFPAPAITETGALPSGVTFTDNGNGTGTLAGTPASGSLGTYAITFTATNGVGSPANQAFTLTVNTAPVITSGSSTTFTVGTLGTFSVTTTGTPTPSLTETGALPGGVTFTDNGNGTATLAGTPTAGGNFPITIKATSASGNTSQNFTLTVDQVPSITSSNSTTFNVGSNGSFTVTTTGTPTPSLTETGTLPSGVSFTDNGNGTGTLSGTPASGTAGSYPITFTATNGIGSPAAQAFTLTVGTAAACTSGGGESLFNGQYAFVLKGFDNGTTPEPALVGGVITVDGAGHITAGALDMNLNSGVQTNLAVTSASSFYKVTAGGQTGCMVITTSAGTQNYRFSLGNISGGVASTGHMIDFDASGPFTAGVLRKQTTSAFGTGAGQVTGNYAFGVSSVQNTTSCTNSVCGGSFGAAGVFNMSGGTVTGGEVDFNNSGFLDGSNTAGGNWATSPVSFTSGSYSVSSTNGRGTLTFTPQGATLVSTVIYVVSSTEVLVMDTDAQTNTIFAGELLKQSGTPFSANPLSGNYVGYQSGPSSSVAGASRVTLLLITPSGTGLTGTQLRNDAGSFQQKSISSVTYTVSSTGRMTLSGAGATNPPIFYLVSANEAFFMDSNSTADSGVFQLQTGGPFSTSSATGNYAFGTIDPEDSNGSVSSGVAAFTPATTTINVTQDQNSNGGGGPQSGTQSFTYTVDSTGLGMIPVSPATSCTISATSTTCQTLFYIISPTKAVVMDTQSSNPKQQLADK